MNLGLVLVLRLKPGPSTADLIYLLPDVRQSIYLVRPQVCDPSVLLTKQGVIAVIGRGRARAGEDARAHYRTRACLDSGIRDKLNSAVQWRGNKVQYAITIAAGDEEYTNEIYGLAFTFTFTLMYMYTLSWAVLFSIVSSSIV